jgi:hypothetical protein
MQVDQAIAQGPQKEEAKISVYLPKVRSDNPGIHIICRSFRTNYLRKERFTVY